MLTASEIQRMHSSASGKEFFFFANLEIFTSGVVFLLGVLGSISMKGGRNLKRIKLHVLSHLTTCLNP